MQRKERSVGIVAKKVTIISTVPSASKPGKMARWAQVVVVAAEVAAEDVVIMARNAITVNFQGMSSQNASGSLAILDTGRTLTTGTKTKPPHHGRDYFG